MGRGDEHKRRILFATDESTKFWGLRPSPEGFEAEHACGWQDVTAALAGRPFDVVVVTYPFGKRPFRRFLEVVRSEDCLSRSAGIVVLTYPDVLEKAVAYIGHGVNRVISVDEASGLHPAIAEVVDVSPRVSARLMVHLTMPLGERDCKISTYTRNISRSGMLLGTSNMLEIGQQFDFSFGVPDTHRRVHGRAEVVRHTIDGRDEVSGIGIRFIDLEEDSHQALAGFLETVLSFDDLDQ